MLRARHGACGVQSTHVDEPLMGVLFMSDLTALHGPKSQIQGTFYESFVKLLPYKMYHTYETAT